MTSTTHDSHESDHTTTAESSNPREPQGTPVLEVSDLNVSFPSEAGSVAAVRGVSFDLYPGRTLHCGRVWFGEVGDLHVDHGVAAAVREGDRVGEVCRRGIIGQNR